MNICAQPSALNAWEKLRAQERARTLAATYFAPSKIAPNGVEDKQYVKHGVDAICRAACEENFGKYWAAFTAQLPADRYRSLAAILQGSLLVNMAGSVLENAGMAMEYICGMPVIPGSAVKGAARRYAIALLEETPAAEKDALLEQIIAVFGCVEDDFTDKGDLWHAYGDAEQLKTLAALYGKRVGGVDFLQAVPATPPKVCADVLTPHHSDYMSGNKTDPVDDEDPTPCFFPAVKGEKDTLYSFSLYAPQAPALLDTAAAWLTQALEQLGIGAKGAAGYGYFTVQKQDLSGVTPEQRDAIIFIANKQSVDKLFATFHKEVEKGGQSKLQCWALLRAVSEDDGKLAAYRAFMSRCPTEKKELKAFEKAKAAIAQLAAESNITLPSV